MNDAQDAIARLRVVADNNFVGWGQYVSQGDARAVLEHIDAQAARLTEIEAILADPHLVHVNMLGGTIAKPGIREMLHVHGQDALARWDSVETLTAERDAALAKVPKIVAWLREQAKKPHLPFRFAREAADVIERGEYELTTKNDEGGDGKISPT